MEFFLFGCAYYPEYMPFDRIETDLQWMKEAGMNTVRLAESTWSTWERRDGEFDFSLLHRTLALCERFGLKAIIGTPTYAVPAWLVKKDSSVLVDGKNGQARYGFRQNMDLWNPTYRFHAERLIRRLMEAVQPYACVIGFQLDNETKHYDNFSPRLQKMFVEELKERFGSVEAMNRAFGLAYWSNSLADWGDFPDLRGCVNASLASAFDAFRREKAAEFLAWQRSIVDEYRRPEQFVTHNLDFEWRKFGAPIAQDGYSYGVQPGISHVTAAEALTVAGADIYHPTQDELTGAEIAFGGDEVRSLKDAPYLILESQAQAFKYWTPYPGQLRLHTLSHLASGAGGQLYWNWHSIHNGYETWWKGVLSHDLEKNAVYDEIARIGKELAALPKELLSMRKENKIALIVDNRSVDALNWFPADKDLSYNDIVRTWYDTLYRMNLECDVLHAEALPERIDRYDMVVTPALYTASDETTALLRTFVEAGGVLLSSFRSFYADENLKMRHGRLPYGLNDVFGVYHQEQSRPGKTTLRGLPIRYYEELLIPAEQTRAEHYEHPVWNRYAALSRHDYGKGSAWYIGCWCDLAILTDVFRRAADRAGIADEGASFPVIVRKGVLPDGRQVRFVLNYSEEESSYLCPGGCSDVLTGRPVHRGEAISLAPWGASVLVFHSGNSDYSR